MIKNLRRCSKCLSMSTRPRISFDDNGVCNACQWNIAKKKIDWDKRIEKLKIILNKEKKKKKLYNCLVPVSGGKDGSYVALKLKNELGMNPLCVTIAPHLPLEIGEKNLNNFIMSDFSHIKVSTPYEITRKLNKIGFEKLGFPYYGWLISIHTAVSRIAVNFDISLIFYGEDGEVEYGGSTETSVNPFYNIEYQKKIYLEGKHDEILKKANLTEAEKYFFTFPEKNISKTLKFTHWSYFENWDPYRNYLYAKKYCGLIENEDTNLGTFTNFAQNDQALYTLHAYLMYLKFGFGRANQDACIEIRRNAMDREQGINLIKIYDGIYPTEYLDEYLEYYKMNKKKFDSILKKWTNKKLFEFKDNKPIPKFIIR